MPNLNLTRILAILIFIYSCIVMLGWIFNIDGLTRILPVGINMQFITAFVFLVSSVALWFIDLAVKGKRDSPLIILPVTSMLILLVMVTILAVGIFSIKIGIVDLFTADNNSIGSIIPGMPAFPTAVSFILFGIASVIVLFESSKTRQLLLYLGIPIILIGAVAVVGYLFQIPILYYRISVISNPIALNTAILFVLLGFGLVFSGRRRQILE